MVKTILMADDEEDLRMLLQMTLNDPGYLLLEASDGAVAWELIQTKRPDLVILDWMMPKKNGKEVAHAMKNDPTTKDIPIIMLTARHRMEDCQQGEELGTYAYLVKPFSPLQLLEKVQLALRTPPD